MGGSWLPADFKLTAFEIFSAIEGSAEWLALEHPILMLLAAEMLIGWKLCRALFR